jgi:betaine-aldehyde dehydrogenase
MMKRLTMELGGKSPLIVFEDCDLDQAVAGAVLANFYSNGEVCSNGTRVFVQAGVHDEFLARLARRVGKLRIGDPREPDVDVVRGPLLAAAARSPGASSRPPATARAP